MLMKLAYKDGGNLDDLAVWQTGYSWLDDGSIHPITAKVFYTRPEFEVIDITLDFDKQLDIPTRFQSMILATVAEEYNHAALKMRQEYHEKAKKVIKTDPYFEE